MYLDFYKAHFGNPSEEVNIGRLLIHLHSYSTRSGVLRLREHLTDTPICPYLPNIDLITVWIWYAISGCIQY